MREVACGRLLGWVWVAGRGGRRQSAQVAEWLMAADCKSAALCATEVRILPCAPFFEMYAVSEGFAMDMAPASTGRMVVALVVLSVLAVLVWRTMEPGKFQQLSWLILGFCGFRVILSKWGTRKFGEKEWSESGQRGHVLPRKSTKG